ncbi:MAG: alpha/beta hydrolase [Bacilli bacterium]|jgi:pimeloyl-ACP methyl ester carboxylesterase|nr:alpha/beta hydrolase [Bacilli bacterium]
MEIIIDNMVVNYEKSGQGQPVILMHGWGQNLEMMYSIVNNLSNSYLVYNIDLPGFGYSDEPSYPYTVSDYVEFLKNFIEINKIINPIIIGHSFGCRIALKYAAFNENVDRMILTGAAGLKSKKNILYYFRIYLFKFFRNFKNFPFIKHYVNEYIENSGSEDYRNSSPMMKEVLKNAINEDAQPYLNNIKVPVLLIFGSEDDATPIWMGEVLNKEIKQSKLIIYDGASHYAYLERNDDFSRDTNNFLKEGIIND